MPRRPKKPKIESIPAIIYIERDRADSIMVEVKIEERLAVSFRVNRLTIDMNMRAVVLGPLLIEKFREGLK